MPNEWLPYIPAIALITSVIALIISGANFGWNIYKEIGLRARLKIRFSLSSIHHPTFEKPLARLTFSVTNLGPGKVHLQMLQLRDAGLWRRLLRNRRFASLIHDYAHPLGGRIPSALDMGEKMDLTFPIDASFISEGFSQIGISDSFGRIHWCKRNDMRQAIIDAKKENLQKS